MLAVLLVLLFLIPGPVLSEKKAEAGAPPPGSAPLLLPSTLLTNEGLLTLAQAGFSEPFLIDLIRRRATRFDVSAEGLARLALHGLSERVIRCVIDNDRNEEALDLAPMARGPEPPVGVQAGRGGKDGRSAR